MSEPIRHILCIDDYDSSLAAENIPLLFPDAQFDAFSDVDDAIDFLQGNDGFTPLDVLVLDCFQQSGIGRYFGYKNAVKIIDWHHEHALVPPRYILFQSADKNFAIPSAEKFERDTGIKCFAVDKKEFNWVRRYLRSLPMERDVELNGYRRFLNQTLGLSIPETKEEADKWQVSNKIWDEDQIVEFARNGRITRDEALSSLYPKTMQVTQWWLDPKVEVEPEYNEEDEFLSREEMREKERQVKNLRFDFAKAVGDSSHGYAAFSLEHVKKLAAKGLKSVLFLSRYDARFVPHLNDMAAVVLTTNNASGHMGILLESHGVTGLLGFEPISETFDFVRKPSGQKLGFLHRLEGAGSKRMLVSYNDAVTDRVVAHRNLHEQKSEAQDGQKDGPIPLLTLNLDELERTHALSFGDPVTVSVAYGGGAIYPGHHKIREKDELHYFPWLNDVRRWLDGWQTEQGQKPLQFKANVDHPNQVDYISDASGIGLLRTEHFILANAEQRKALRNACFDGDKESFKQLSEFLTKDLNDFFYYGDLDAPIRVRLLDAPPSEFYDKKEQALLTERFGQNGTRGVQLAEQIPAVYAAQLDGIFTTVRIAREREIEMWGEDDEFSADNRRRLEILIPTVRTAEELCFALHLTKEAADRQGISHDKYKFGSMLETIEACENIAFIAPHCDFLSIGTNDLTSEVLDCARDDWNKRHALLERDGVDPFVTLHPKVLEILTTAVETARKAKPDIQIDLCGAHAANIQTLELLRPMKLDGVSMPCTRKNMIGLNILYGYNEFFRQKGIDPMPKDQPEAHI